MHAISVADITDSHCCKRLERFLALCWDGLLMPGGEFEGKIESGCVAQIYHLSYGMWKSPIHNALLEFRPVLDRGLLAEWCRAQHRVSKILPLSHLQHAGTTLDLSPCTIMQERILMPVVQPASRLSIQIACTFKRSKFTGLWWLSYGGHHHSFPGAWAKLISMSHNRLQIAGITGCSYFTGTSNAPEMVALLGLADIESRAPGPFDALVVAGADCTARPAKEGLQETAFLWWVNCTGCTWLFESWDCLTTLLVFERTILHVVREYDSGTWIFSTSLDINCELLSCSTLLKSCLGPTAKEFLACIPFLTDCEPSVFCIFAGADCAGSSGSVASVQSAKTPLPSWTCRLNDLDSSRSGL